jgi:hypothetical protein
MSDSDHTDQPGIVEFRITRSSARFAAYPVYAVILTADFLKSEFDHRVNKKANRSFLPVNKNRAIAIDRDRSPLNADEILRVHK